VRIQAVISRSFLWKLMILAVGVRFVVGPYLGAGLFIAAWFFHPGPHPIL
jgi:hypothetical protein